MTKGTMPEKRTLLALKMVVLGMSLLPLTLAFQGSFQPGLHFTNARRRSQNLFMKSNIMFNVDSKLPQLPRDVKEAVSSCREATQKALQNRISRMEIEFPVGTKFGVEKTGKSKQRDATTTTPTRQDFERSDRELARIFVEMFQPVGSDRIVVAFETMEGADAAKTQWKEDSASSGARIVSMDRRKSTAMKKKNKNRGFAAKLAAEIDETTESGPFQLPEQTEVALFVAPGPKEFIIIERICQQVGMGTLVILLNARIGNIAKFASPEAERLFRDEFESVFCLTAAQQAPGCLLYRKYDESWVLARKPKVGQPKTIIVQKERPKPEECHEAFDKLELSDLEKNVENAMENIAGWFR